MVELSSVVANRIVSLLISYNSDTRAIYQQLDVFIRDYGKRNHFRMKGESVTPFGEGITCVRGFGEFWRDPGKIFVSSE